MNKPVVGVVGTGRMGEPMTRNLLKAGYHVNVYDVRDSAYENLLPLGASYQSSPREIGRTSDVILLSLLNAQTVEEVLFGTNGLAAIQINHKLIIDTSSYAPCDTRRFAARIKELGGAMLDAPVTGGEAGARDGTLNIMIGGEDAVFEQASALLAVLGKTVVHIGPSGSGQVAKMVNQILMAGLYVVIVEAFAFAEKADVDVGRILQAVETGGAQSRQLSQLARSYAQSQAGVEDKLSPELDHYLHVYNKDVYCVLQEAHSMNGYTPVTALTHEIFKQVLSGKFPGAWPLKMIELWRDLDR